MAREELVGLIANLKIGSFRQAKNDTGDNNGTRVVLSANTQNAM